MTEQNARNDIVIVTGLSGAGLSTVLRSLEDLGYEAIDNLPIALARAAAQDRKDTNRPLAIAIDCRTRDFNAGELIELKTSLINDMSLNVALVVVRCDENILQHRFSETRRTHPLAQDRTIMDGISLENSLLAPLYDHADHMIDTTDLTVHDTRRIVAGLFDHSPAHGVLTFVTSFGFRNGVPREADLVFDVRFLWNPHYDPALRPLNGRDQAIQDRLSEEKDFHTFFDNLKGMLEHLIPLYEAEGKSYLTIGIGCTGGRHRSVFTAEKLYEWLDANGHSTAIKHRDLEKWFLQQRQQGDKVVEAAAQEAEKKAS